MTFTAGLEKETRGTPPEPGDDNAMTLALIGHRVFDWVTEYSLHFDPEVIAPLALSLARQANKTEEVLDRLALRG